VTAGGILLDTNVVSEMVAPEPAVAVRRWMAGQAPASLYLSVITLGELAYGVARLEAGRKRDRLSRWVQEELTAQFTGRVLPLDPEAAARWGELRALGERRGRPRSTADLQIAAIALTHGMTLATRNLADFEELGVPLVDPWLA